MKHDECNTVMPDRTKYQVPSHQGGKFLMLSLGHLTASKSSLWFMALSSREAIAYKYQLKTRSNFRRVA